jgi:predicted transglutaminase-like cysteine proteinase
MVAATPALAEADPLAPVDSVNSTITVTARRSLPDNPDVLGTAALNAGVTIYDVRFRRVSAADRDNAELRAIAAQLAGLGPVEQLARVKTLVEQRIRFSSDLETMRVSDYWANAGDTLKRGAGDDEDIAIVEMQALKAAGFRASDLYISIGRHKSRGAHAVLIARTPQGFFVLDQAEGQVIAANGGPRRFVPMMTIGAGRSYLHGYRVGSAAMGAN